MADGDALPERARRLLILATLLTGCASTPAGPRAAAGASRYGGECAPEAVFVPNMNAAYQDDEGVAYAIGDTCFPCSRALGFWYPSGTICLLDPEGLVVELAPVGGTKPNPSHRLVARRAVAEIALPKRRKLLEALLRGGPPSRADYEGLLAGYTKPKPTPQAPSQVTFEADHEYPLFVEDPPGHRITIAMRYEANHEHRLVDARVYAIDPAGQLVLFRWVEQEARGICNRAEWFVELGVIAWEAVEPPERARVLRETLVTRPTEAGYARFVAGLTTPPLTVQTSVDPRARDGGSG